MREWEWEWDCDEGMGMGMGMCSEPVSDVNVLSLSPKDLKVKSPKDSKDCSTSITLEGKFLSICFEGSVPVV